MRSQATEEHNEALVISNVTRKKEGMVDGLDFVLCMVPIRPLLISQSAIKGNLMNF